MAEATVDGQNRRHARRRRLLPRRCRCASPSADPPAAIAIAIAIDRRLLHAPRRRVLSHIDIGETGESVGGPLHERPMAARARQSAASLRRRVTLDRIGLLAAIANAVLIRTCLRCFCALCHRDATRLRLMLLRRLLLLLCCFAASLLRCCSHCCR